MPAHQPKKAATRLAAVRGWRNVTQQELAAAVGLSHTHYRRLEQGTITNPPLRWLVNCARALGVPLSDIIEPAWLEWFEPFAPPGEPPVLPAPPEAGFWSDRRSRGPRERPPWLSEAATPAADHELFRDLDSL